jgi:hypothetical protein
MPPRLPEVTENRLFAQLPASFQTMQALHQDEAVAVLPHQDNMLSAISCTFWGASVARLFAGT